MTFTISPAIEEEVRSGEIGRRLREFNYTYVGEYPATESIRLNAREADGSVVGGIRAVVTLYWLRVEGLWVHEAARGKDIGSRLLVEAERLARETGARNGPRCIQGNAPGGREQARHPRGSYLNSR